MALLCAFSPRDQQSLGDEKSKPPVLYALGIGNAIISESAGEFEER